MPSKGKRYTEEERVEILAFVDDVNAESGTGGIKRASEKFGVTAMTLSRWLRERSAVGDGDLKGKLLRMADLLERITVVEEELGELRREYQRLKRGI